MFKNCGVMSSLEEIHPKKTEQEYLAQIEQLQNELDLEKKIRNRYLLCYSRTVGIIK